MRHRTLLLAALLPAAALLLPCRAAAAAEKERAAVPDAPRPLLLGGVRYEAPPFTRVLGLPHNGGFVIAYDAASGHQLWTAEVYGLAGREGLETDKREVFIVALEPSADRRHLLVTDERGRRWQLDLATRRAAPRR